MRGSHEGSKPVHRSPTLPVNKTRRLVWALFRISVACTSTAFFLYFLGMDCEAFINVSRLRECVTVNVLILDWLRVNGQEEEYIQFLLERLIDPIKYNDKALKNYINSYDANRRESLQLLLSFVGGVKSYDMVRGNESYQLDDLLTEMQLLQRRLQTFRSIIWGTYFDMTDFLHQLRFFLLTIISRNIESFQRQQVAEQAMELLSLLYYREYVAMVRDTMLKLYVDYNNCTTSNITASNNNTRSINGTTTNTTTTTTKANTTTTTTNTTKSNTTTTNTSKANTTTTTTNTTKANTTTTTTNTTINTFDRLLTIVGYNKAKNQFLFEVEQKLPQNLENSYYSPRTDPMWQQCNTLMEYVLLEVMVLDDLQSYFTISGAGCGGHGGGGGGGFPPLGWYECCNYLLHSLRPVRLELRQQIIIAMDDFVEELTTLLAVACVGIVLELFVAFTLIYQAFLELWLFFGSQEVVKSQPLSNRKKSTS